MNASFWKKGFKPMVLISLYVRSALTNRQSHFVDPLKAIRIIKRVFCLAAASNGEYVGKPQQIGVDGALFLQHVVEGGEPDFSVQLADHDRAPALEQGLYGRYSQSARQISVEATGASTALDVTQDGHPRVVLGRDGFQVPCDFGGAAAFPTFRNKHDARRFVMTSGHLQPAQQLLFFHLALGDEHRQGAGSQTRVHGDKSRIPAHDLHEKKTVVRRRGVADFVDRVDHGIQRRVEPYGEVGAPQIVVNSARHTDDGDVVFLGKYARTREGAVTTDRHHGVHPAVAEVFVRAPTPFLREKSFASRRLQDGSATLQNVVDRAHRKVLD